jgi:glycosyltransferase involved in cell wall biosynthesis
MDKKITAVIPALNEEDTIEKVIHGLRGYVSEIILVDDGSRDSTAEIASREGAIVLSHKENMGYDKSIDDGFSLAAHRGADIVLTFDADGQHESQDIPSIVKPIIEGTADLVVGKRPYKARITEYVFAWIARRKVGIDDPLCGLKAYDIKVYKDVGFFDRLSSIGTELMFRAKKKGYRIVQRDISLNKRADTPRFGRILKANWKIFKAIVKTTIYT